MPLTKGEREEGRRAGGERYRKEGPSIMKKAGVPPAFFLR
jgi:hypothetical protein